MTSKLEEIASRCLRASLAGLPLQASISTSDHFSKFQSALELLVPSLLVDKYPWWRRESLDAFEFAVARRLRREEAEFIGLCLLITDQAWTPFHLRLRISPRVDQIEALECKLGESGVGNGGMVRAPYGSLRATKLLYSVERRLQSISWAYTITRGSLNPEGRTEHASPDGASA